MGTASVYNKRWKLSVKCKTAKSGSGGKKVNRKGNFRKNIMNLDVYKVFLISLLLDGRMLYHCILTVLHLPFAYFTDVMNLTHRLNKGWRLSTQLLWIKISRSRLTTNDRITEWKHWNDERADSTWTERVGDGRCEYKGQEINTKGCI